MTIRKIPSRVAGSVGDQILALKVASRFQRVALSTGEDEETSTSGRPPPRWREWLETTQDGGKRLVPNPNPDPLSRQRHPQVSFSTALKNDAFRDKAVEAYKRWEEKSKPKEEAQEAGATPEEVPQKSKAKVPSAENSTTEKPTAEKSTKEEAPKKSWKERLKGLGEKAAKFVNDAPKEVKRFIEDEGFRRKTIQGIHKSLVEAPEKITQSVIKTVKHEVHEYKEAGQGISAAIRGKKMSPSQSKAVKSVATHLAIGIAAAALTSAGPLGAAGALAKGMAKHVALKAVSRALGHIHVLQEIGHIGHGVEGLMSHLASTGNPQVILFRYADDAARGGDPNPDDIFGNFMTASVAKELENIDDDSIEESLKLMDGDDSEQIEGEETSEEGDTVKVDLNDVDEIWFVKKKDDETEKMASRVVNRYRG